MAFTIMDDEAPKAGGFTITDAPPAKPLGPPEELTALERFASRLPDWMAGPSGGVRGSAVGRLAMGAADPGVAAVQIAANLVGQGEGVNKAISETEAKYQAARGAAGSEGFDPLRMIGNVAITAPAGLVGKAATTLGGMAVKGAAQGAVSGALNPVTEGEFFEGKADQVGMGAAGGALLAPVAGALGRVISPNASTNADLALLRESGVRPTIGQALGGAWNVAEQKATSLPIVGDAIASARRKSIEGFNTAAINNALDPVGRGIPAGAAGLDAVSAAKAGISKSYDAALNSIKGVNFDTPRFNAEFAKLNMMAAELPEPLARKFSQEIRDTVLNQMSPNGSMLPETFQKVASKLRVLETQWSKSSNMLDRDLGAAFGELRNSIEGEAARQVPQFAAAKKASDAAWARISAVKEAARAAVNRDGVFTPAQFNRATRAADQSPGKWATVDQRFSSQRLGQAAQNVLGDTYPDSGTVGRALTNVGALGSAAINPAIPAALAAGAVAYAPPIQNALVYLLRTRPQAAPEIANAVRNYLVGPAAIAGGDYASGGLSR